MGVDGYRRLFPTPLIRRRSRVTFQAGRSMEIHTAKHLRWISFAPNEEGGIYLERVKDRTATEPLVSDLFYGTMNLRQMYRPTSTPTSHNTSPFLVAARGRHVYHADSLV